MKQPDSTEARGGLNAAHRKIAEGWHTSLRALGKRGYKLLSAQETNRAVRCHTPSIEIPYQDLNGKPLPTVRYRLADPSKSPDRKRKYTTPKGAPIALFLPPGIKWKKIAEDPGRTIYVTEGEAKAQFLADHYELPVIGIQGCWAWQAQGKPAVQFAWFEWEGRRVVLIPDSDCRRNPDVRRGFARLGKFLQEQKAEVSVLPVPDLPEDFRKEPGAKYKTGIDDWCYATDADAEAFATLRKQLALPLEHPDIQAWDGSAVTTLPEVLRNLKPVDDAWISEAPPKSEYVVAPYWQVGETATAVGPASVGKTYFLMRMLIAIATGTPFFQFPVHRKRRVMYLLAERSDNSARRRFHKIMHDVADQITSPREREQFLADIKANVIIRVVSGETFNLIEQVNGQWQVAPAVDAFIAELEAASVSALFLDPLSRLHGGDEDNAVFSAVTKALERIVRAGVSAMVAHHTGKAVRGDMYSGRGGSAFNDNTSETIVLTTVAEEDRRGLNLSALKPEDHGADLILVHHARCSDGAPAPDVYLLRKKDSGLLRYIKVDRKSADDVLADYLPSIRRWAGEKAFTRNEFRAGRATFAEKLSKRDAEGMFEDAVHSGVFIDTGNKRRGGALYNLQNLEMASLPDNSRATGNLKSKGWKSQKTGVRKSA